ncbi:winged helix-turn-helix transcriptional regulator [Roseibium sp. SCP14]|uniref:winged helix-turn-helix transcriptional regulator n=1 Tax=Roseibium sp. SCP14 TaxID=3141375 RepID=UPI00333A6658
MSDIKPDPYAAACPSRKILSIISDKWSLLVIPLLIKKPLRHAELLKAIEGISQKMLTQTLRRLEQHGLVERHDYHEVPPRVDYRLTKLGRSLSGIIGELDNWVIDNFDSLTAPAHKA